MASTTQGRKIAPGAVDAEEAARALRRIRDYLDHTTQPDADIEIHFETGDKDVLVLPRPVADMFASVLATLANGQGVQLMPVNAELTTQQAADMLNVSRPYLIRLLEANEIPHRLVGRHRRIRFEDIMNYLREDDRKRQDAAGELTQLDQELGLV
ncbi:helix-turn-helix domain-containing protein [Streptacidiphilus carbonis]|uniref:helix-turn-helix domain-containing protein n=1 Tax=Streptacidiphilus carbonis TaxID=105422 RepID=UPI0005A760A8|nr:helix-turn-helix domain-containing protein [Streptacidiphilus carbonis]